MPKKPVDLQIHTTASDGKFSPKEIVDLAIKKGMKAIAITDHDTVLGVKEAVEYGKEKGLEVVPGVELSCHEDFYSKTIDVLGLFIDYKNKYVHDFLENSRNERVKEKKLIIEKLNSLGYKISWDEYVNQAGHSLGRPNLAALLIKKYPKKFSTIQQVFDELISEGKPAFVERKKVTIKEAIKVIKKANGVSILAHPGRYGGDTLKIIRKFIDMGGEGIEVDYPYDKVIGINNNINDKFREIAREKNLLISGGSDFHDFSRKSEIGDGGLTQEEFQELKQRSNIT